MRILFSWVGFKDLIFIDSKLGDSDFHHRVEEAKKNRPTASKTSKHSPVFSVISKSLEDKRPFSKIVLLAGGLHVIRCFPALRATAPFTLWYILAGYTADSNGKFLTYHITGCSLHSMSLYDSSSKSWEKD